MVSGVAGARAVGGRPESSSSLREAGGAGGIPAGEKQCRSSVRRQNESDQSGRAKSPNVDVLEKDEDDEGSLPRLPSRSRSEESGVPTAS